MSGNGPEPDLSSEQNYKEMIRKIDESEFVLSVIPSSREELDVPSAAQLGLAIMLDKPIVAVVFPGYQFPEKYRKVVDQFIEIDPNDPNARQKMTDAIQEMLDEGRL